jgi:hypothetical protein
MFDILGCCFSKRQPEYKHTKWRGTLHCFFEVSSIKTSGPKKAKNGLVLLLDMFDILGCCFAKRQPEYKHTKWRNHNSSLHRKSNFKMPKNKLSLINSTLRRI